MTHSKSKPIKENHLVSQLYQNWFMDYASYVILERAVPCAEDGLKPVQRRIMHALKEMDDGRFNKVANLIGNTMQYHPHGDASIGDAIVNLGQKNLLFDIQGNWGDIHTGDASAAPRYIEVRLSKLALECIYNPQTTIWQRSYDGRKKEPVTLPVKLPLLLLLGTDGIAVGLSTKIFPHNFYELIQASIQILKGQKVNIYPDFPTGGMADISEYNQGLRGGKIKIRSHIDIENKTTLIIRDLPYSVTTTSLIESIIKASEQGKIKIKQVIDNTAKEVEIRVQLHAGISPEISIDALYAFTDCEISLSPNACIIMHDKPNFIAVDELLAFNTEQTKNLLKQELTIKIAELKEKFFFSSLEKIFIENRIYRQIESCESFDDVVRTTLKGLKPYQNQFYRDINHEDILKLLDIKIKRISKYDALKNTEELQNIQTSLTQTQHDYKHLNKYAITYFQTLLKKYGKGKERKTELKNFQSIQATEVIATNARLYINRVDGFVGSGLRKEEFVCDCSELDDVLVIRQDGIAIMDRIRNKKYMGKNILHVGIWKKNDDNTIYNLVYSDLKTGISYVKKFTLIGMIRDKEYDLTSGNPSKVQYISANTNGEMEKIEVRLGKNTRSRKKVFEFDFSTLDTKGKGARGNIISKYSIRLIKLKEKKAPASTSIELWFDQLSGRLNKDKQGLHLGNFSHDDHLLIITSNGNYKTTNYNIMNRYDPEKTLLIEKLDSKKIVSAIYYDPKKKAYFIKRFHITTTTVNKEFCFISNSPNAQLTFVSLQHEPVVQIEYSNPKMPKEKLTETLALHEIEPIKEWKSRGKKLPFNKIKKITSMDLPDVNKPPTTTSRSIQKANYTTNKKATSKKIDHKSKKEKTFQVGDSITLNLK